MLLHSPSKTDLLIWHRMEPISGCADGLDRPAFRFRSRLAQQGKIEPKKAPSSGWWLEVILKTPIHTIDTGCVLSKKYTKYVRTCDGFVLFEGYIDHEIEIEGSQLKFSFIKKSILKTEWGSLWAISVGYQPRIDKHWIRAL